MNNTPENIQVGKRYTVFGTRYVKVVKISDRHIEVVHGMNGQTPRRYGDRFFPVRWSKHFQEIT
ncbi:hypothetical protein EBT31_12005 [bacterium]|nr:hypothetical protein [bacterium]